MGDEEDPRGSQKTALRPDIVCEPGKQVKGSLSRLSKVNTLLSRSIIRTKAAPAAPVPVSVHVSWSDCYTELESATTSSPSMSALVRPRLAWKDLLVVLLLIFSMLSNAHMAIVLMSRCDDWTQGLAPGRTHILVAALVLLLLLATSP
jgi:hypothetical protein